MRAHVAARLGDHRAPFGGAGRRAEAEEGEAGEREQRRRERGRRHRRDRAGDPRQDVPRHDPPRRRAERVRGQHEGTALLGDDEVAHEPRVFGRGYGGERHDDCDEPDAQRPRHDERHRERRHGEHALGEAHRDPVRETADHAGNEPGQPARGDRERHHHGGRDGRHREAVKEARENVAPELIGAERVRDRGFGQAAEEVRLRWVVGRRERREEDDRRGDRHDGERSARQSGGRGGRGGRGGGAQRDGAGRHVRRPLPSGGRSRRPRDRRRG